MYFVLYDRNLKSIGETYILESWSRVERAVDFDDLRIIGEQIPFSADPFLVVCNDHQGKMRFSGLASTPSIDETSKKTTIILKDYMTLFNSEIIVDWTKLYTDMILVDFNLSSYLEHLLNIWKSNADPGLSNIVWDLGDLSELILDKDIIPHHGKESILASNLIFNLLHYYNIYCTVHLSMFTHTLTFSFRRALVNPISLRLKDFGMPHIEKSYGEYNRATIYSEDFIKNQTWALTKDNSVVKLPTDKELIYPSKNRNYIARVDEESDGIDTAVYDAVMELSSNRYQENISIEAHKYTSILDLTNLDFSSAVDVYMEDGYYKRLPVGEIETDSKGNHIIRLGYGVQELTQEI